MILLWKSVSICAKLLLCMSCGPFEKEYTIALSKTAIRTMVKCNLTKLCSKKELLFDYANACMTLAFSWQQLRTLSNQLVLVGFSLYIAFNLPHPTCLSVFTCTCQHIRCLLLDVSVRALNNNNFCGITQWIFVLQCCLPAHFVYFLFHMQLDQRIIAKESL